MWSLVERAMRTNAPHLRADWLRAIKVESREQKKRLNNEKQNERKERERWSDSAELLLFSSILFQLDRVRRRAHNAVIAAALYRRRRGYRVFRNVKVIKLISILHAVCRSTPHWRVRVSLLLFFFSYFQLLSVDPIVFTECRVWLMDIVADGWTKFSRIVYARDDRAPATALPSGVRQLRSTCGKPHRTNGERSNRMAKAHTHTLRHGRAN